MEKHEAIAFNDQLERAEQYRWSCGVLIEQAAEQLWIDCGCEFGQIRGTVPGDELWIDCGACNGTGQVHPTPDQLVEALSDGVFGLILKHCHPFEGVRHIPLASLNILKVFWKKLDLKAV